MYEGMLAYRTDNVVGQRCLTVERLGVSVDVSASEDTHKLLSASDCSVP